MTAKTDLTASRLARWDAYAGKPPDEVLASVYADVQQASSRRCDWYWTSIRVKRRTSLGARALAFALLAMGSTLPLLAALQHADGDKLLFTQVAVGLLATAGLVQLADKVFGWSSGWMRYVGTVTAMESLTRDFQLQWGRYLVARAGPPDAEDAQALYDLARALERQLARLQADETGRWVAEFNAGLLLLDGAIEPQREDAGRLLAAAAVTARASRIWRPAEWPPARPAGDPRRARPGAGGGGAAGR